MLAYPLHYTKDSVHGIEPAQYACQERVTTAPIPSSTRHILHSLLLCLQSLFLEQHVVQYPESPLVVVFSVYSLCLEIT